MLSVIETAMDHVQAIATGDDASRLAARREKKRDGGRLRATMCQADIGQKQADAVAARIAAASDKCETICAPLRERREQAKQKIADAAADGLPIPAEAQAELCEVEGKIAAATEELDREVNILNALHNTKLKEVRELRVEAAALQAVINSLAQPPLANPKMLAEHFAQSEISAAIHSLARAAQEKITEAEYWAAEAQKHPGKYGDAETYIDRVPKWRALVNACEPIRRQAEEATARLRQEMLDE